MLGETQRRRVAALEVDSVDFAAPTSQPPRWTNMTMPAMISAQESANAIFHTPRKLTCGRWRNTCCIWNDFIQPFATSQSKTSRVTNTPENRLANKPMMSVTPKPFTGPLPMETRMTPVRMAVKWASKMTRNARV